MVTVVTMTLTEFLRARFDEDEVAARVCAEAFPAPWDVSDRGHTAFVRADEPNFLTVTELDQRHETPGRWPGEHLDHIARHDPARVLAEVEAKRRMLSLLTGAEFALDCHPDDPGEQGHVAGIRKAVALLALPYADHPDYQQEWRP